MNNGIPVYQAHAKKRNRSFKSAKDMMLGCVAYGFVLLTCIDVQAIDFRVPLKIEQKSYAAWQVIVIMVV